MFVHIWYVLGSGWTDSRMVQSLKISGSRFRRVGSSFTTRFSREFGSGFCSGVSGSKFRVGQVRSKFSGFGSAKTAGQRVRVSVRDRSVLVRTCFRCGSTRLTQSNRVNTVNTGQLLVNRHQHYNSLVIFLGYIHINKINKYIFLNSLTLSQGHEYTAFTLELSYCVLCVLSSNKTFLNEPLLTKCPIPALK
ncbi:hypothetical protein Hanom_Chr04g00367251 [Helianthus anomalus]